MQHGASHVAPPRPTRPRHPRQLNRFLIALAPGAALSLRVGATQAARRTRGIGLTICWKKCLRPPFASGASRQQSLAAPVPSEVLDFGLISERRSRPARLRRPRRRQPERGDPVRDRAQSPPGRHAGADSQAGGVSVSPRCAILILEDDPLGDAGTCSRRRYGTRTLSRQLLETSGVGTGPPGGDQEGGFLTTPRTSARSATSAALPEQVARLCRRGGLVKPVTPAGRTVGSPRWGWPLCPPPCDAERAFLCSYAPTRRRIAAKPTRAKRAASRIIAHPASVGTAGGQPVGKHTRTLSAPRASSRD